MYPFPQVPSYLNLHEVKFKYKEEKKNLRNWINKVI